mmetsp:Transcript_19398/g.40130  ORF Transcript_19398/g.40130 Transcript_19398/m.40130 type:complete len:878 (+) Transcript_19398:62-2695(+)
MTTHPQPNARNRSDPLIEASQVGYAIDVRVFLAIITTTMAVAFGAGVMMGPSDPALVIPVLNLMGMPIPPGLEQYRRLDGMNFDDSISVSSAAGKFGADYRAPTITTHSGSKKAKIQQGVISADGNIVIHDDDEDDEDDNVRITQPRREATNHIATLGQKIRETHVNIDTPVLEGTADDLPFERDIYISNASGDEDIDAMKNTNLRDQTMPSGQHLLVDIKNVDAAFLNSESRLAEAMVKSVEAAGLTMLSYHCHSLHPAGVSCVGVLLESHISFHTWPDEGVITLDMFTTSSKPLLPALPEIERLFGVPRVNAETGEEEEPVSVWSHELRGFRTDEERRANVYDDNSDLSNWITSPLEVTKKQIVTVKTEIQQIDIWDASEREDLPSYEDGVRLGFGPDDPRWMQHEYASPTRLLFLDGALLAIADSDAEFHESLVHPGMFAHPSPKNVAILGGGDGATLREVLRHRSVEKVTMIEKDAKLVELARVHLPKMCNCSEIVGSTEVCFDDARVELVYQQPKDYFALNNLTDIDFLVLDGTVPETDREVPEHWFNDKKFVDAMIDSLSENGVLATQVGTAPTILDPRADLSVFRHRERFINSLEANPKIKSIFIYEEAHCGFYEPKAFLVACRDVTCRRHWYAETDEIDYAIYDRIGGLKDGKPSLVHYDGATQRSFQAPPRAWETVYCRREPEPFECAYRGLDKNAELFEFDPENEEESSFEIRMSKNKETGEEEVGVYAKVDMPEGSYLMPTHLAASFEVSDDSMENVHANTQIEGVDKATVIEDFIDFIDTHGHPSIQEGSGKNYVEVGGSFMMRISEDPEEANVRRWIPSHPNGGRPKFSPVYDRHRHSFDVFLVASRDIKAGEEVVKPVGLWDI